MKGFHWLTRRTLVRRVVLTLLCAFPLVWVVLTAYEYVHVTDREKENQRIRTVVGVLLGAVSQAQTPGEARAAVGAIGHVMEEFRKLNAAPNANVLQLLDRSNGQLVYSSDASFNEPLPGAPGQLVDLPMRGRTYCLFKDESARWAVRRRRRTSWAVPSRTGRAPTECSRSMPATSW